MAAATVIRVKRRLDDNPQDALLLMCKRFKTDSEISPSLFVFRATVVNQEIQSVKSIIPKSEVKFKPGTDVNDIIKKLREERKNTTTESRYEVVNLSRGLTESVDDEVLNLVDLEEKKIQDDASYAYDLYTTAKNDEDFDISLLDNLVCIENYENEFIFGSYRDNGRITPSTENDDDDDSNDENNWRNDYPDSDNSINEEDIIKAVEKITIEDDLSSDTGEDKIYDDNDERYKQDLKMYGAAYAKYKARVLSEQPDLADTNSFVHCSQVKDIDEESVEGYKDDRDDGFYYGEEDDAEQFKDQYDDDDDSSDLYEPD